MKKSIAQINDLINTHPGAEASVCGIGFDGDRATVSVQLAVPCANNDPAGISALQLAHDINLSLFDYAPFYSSAPSMEERAVADKLFEMLNAEMQEETERAYVVTI